MDKFKENIYQLLKNGRIDLALEKLSSSASSEEGTEWYDKLDELKKNYQLHLENHKEDTPNIEPSSLQGITDKLTDLVETMPRSATSVGRLFRKSIRLNMVTLGGALFIGFTILEKSFGVFSDFKELFGFDPIQSIVGNELPCCLSGSVHDENGAELKNIVVVLNDTIKVSTDAKGQFNFLIPKDLRSMHHELRINHSEYSDWATKTTVTAEFPLEIVLYNY